MKKKLTRSKYESSDSEVEKESMYLEKSGSDMESSNSEIGEVSSEILSEPKHKVLHKNGQKLLNHLCLKDYSSLDLKVDHLHRPIYILENSRIILEAFSNIANQAIDFLIAIAEPVSRQKLIHEYKITEYSLYAVELKLFIVAISVGLTSESIIKVLETLTKTKTLPESVLNFITKHTRSFGKVKLVLKKAKYYIEVEDTDILKILLNNEIISECRIKADENGVPDYNVESLKREPYDGKSINGVIKNLDAAICLSKEKNGEISKKSFDPFVDDWFSSDEEDNFGIDDGAFLLAMQNFEKNYVQDSSVITINDADEGDGEFEAVKSIKSFEIAKDKLENVKKICSELNYPLLEEYDFKIDAINPTIQLDLKSTTTLRPYQEKSLSKMFGDGRARSGIIVLPCGSGKTLVGVTAACTIKKSCLVLCTSSVSVEQWAREFKTWSSVNHQKISKFTSNNKEMFSKDTDIVISTYTMLTFHGKRAYDAQKKLDFIKSKEWGFLLLDEVHVVPADMFKKVLTIAPAHCKLGLTATLVREDEKIKNLNYLIGPKLYEANWMELANEGHIARVQCAEVWCPMAPEFYREYLRQPSRKKQLLFTMNPYKIQACQYLIDYHEARGDKIIVFSDNVFALKHYATRLHKPFIFGGTSQTERLKVLNQFRYNPTLNTIFISKIGDTSIDIPEASCLIQISSHYGSRRQEAQRLGRILRSKGRSGEPINAYFYTLVSKDTHEMYYSTKRQQFLIDQGYQFKIITNLEGIELFPDLVYPNLTSQLELLNTVLIHNDLTQELIDSETEMQEVDEEETFSDDDFKVVRKAGNISSFSGGDSMAYIEVQRTARK
ncbi:hypothetical protein HDU92_002221, partial [Lobulomyces angularis]